MNLFSLHNYYNDLDDEKYWKKYYHLFNINLKNRLQLPYSTLVKILYKVDHIIDKAKLTDVYLDLSEQINDPLTLIINSQLSPYYLGIDSPLVAIELRKIFKSTPMDDLFIVLYTKKSDFKYIGTLSQIKVFLSYLIYYGRI